MTTRTPPLLTLSRVLVAPVLFCDCGKMPTKRGKSTKVCRAEQAVKVAHRQQLYAVGGLSSSSESVSLVNRPGATPPGVKVPQVRPTDHGNVAVATGHDTPGIPSPQAGQWE